MSWALPIEAAIISGDVLVFGAAVPPLIQFFKGLSAKKLQNDVEELSQKLVQANEDSGKLKRKLSDMIQNHGRIMV
ncbi:unnamed protein product [Didymodactylos carnosus]|uniref:Uncharacterized protein n=2 Tax=Didymodactylos carnosus TaxID=1234261 RepID=A0A8S2DXD4_9BILA|nr:unnamed protein product [Didymodactylos carnosus]CAF3769363.1 unnamed protein product [Didymodactylos carnosus]